MINVRPAGRPIDLRGKNFVVAIFSESMINVKLCMVVLLTELYRLISLSMTLIFQGHSGVSFN